MNMRPLSVVFVCLLWAAATLHAAPPATLGYQGRLSTLQGVRVNGPTDLQFRIYDVATGGTPLWEESQGGVVVADGIFTVILGKTNALTGLAFDKPYYLGVAINGGNEMTPRMEMSSAPYAMNTVKQSTSAADAYVKAITTPENVTVTSMGSGDVKVTWDPVKGATSYNLYLATQSGVNASNYASKTNGRMITGVTTPYTVTGLTTGSQYYFAVASVTPVGESLASLESTVTPGKKYDVAADFSATLNPNGAWSYGAGVTGSSFTLNYLSDGFSGAWGQGSMGVWTFLPTGDPKSCGGSDLDINNTICVRPAGNTNHSDNIVRWISPAPASYHITGKIIRESNYYSDGINFMIYHNSTQKVSQHLAPGGQYSFDLTLTAQVGDVVLFGVNDSGWGNGDSQSISITIE
ncbi:MAG: fibronectin type III domain-containing protein [Magnetococcales bacterium]|nr:fibronectin type III domain-containing protein [Magnetococcales bacterium]